MANKHRKVWKVVSRKLLFKKQTRPKTGILLHPLEEKVLLTTIFLELAAKTTAILFML
jgi:hypothetical protein